MLLILLAACAPEPADDTGDTAADLDLDGVPDAQDCAPEDPEVHPGAAERCNGVDDDCDAATPDAGARVGTQSTATVQEAVDLAAPGALVELCPGTYVEVLTVTKDLVIAGGSETSLTVLDGGGADAVVHVDEASLTLRALTVRGGAGHTEAGAVRGGGLYATDAQVTLEDVAFESNVAADGGGAVRVEGGTLSVLRGRFEGNFGYHGAVEAVGVDALDVRESSFVGNRGQFGGGLAVRGAAACSVAGTSFTGNAAAAGGAIYVSEADCGFETVVVDGNEAATGGGLYALDAALGLVDSAVTANQATDGAGLVLLAGTLELAGTRVERNVATGGGGGIWLVADGADATLLADDASELLANQAAWGGGLWMQARPVGEGLPNVGAAGLRVTDNQALEGGGVFVESGAAGCPGSTTLDTPALSGNLADRGGGLYAECPMTVLGGSIVGNQATSGGGAAVEAGPFTGYAVDWVDNVPDDLWLVGADQSLGALGNDATFTCDPVSGVCTN